MVSALEGNHLIATPSQVADHGAVFDHLGERFVAASRRADTSNEAVEVLKVQHGAQSQPRLAVVRDRLVGDVESFLAQRLQEGAVVVVVHLTQDVCPCIAVE
jgi:hypothetical protein